MIPPNSVKPLASALLVLGCLSGSLQAATFTVTNGNIQGPGSLRQALIDANASPGKDQVVVDPSVTNIYPNVTPNGDPWVGNRLLITESVDVIGHGSSTLVIDDLLTWIGDGREGLVENPPGYTPCDADDGLLKASDLIFQIGDPRVADNSGIEVLLQGFTVTRAGGLLLGAGGPYVKLVDVVVRDTASATPIDQCHDSQIYIQGELEIVDSAIYDNTPPVDWGVIRVGGGPLRIVNSTIGFNYRENVISGPVDPTLNPLVFIENSEISLGQSQSLGGQFETSIVNSVIVAVERALCTPLLFYVDSPLTLRNVTLIALGNCGAEGPGSHLALLGGELHIANTLVWSPFYDPVLGPMVTLGTSPVTGNQAVASSVSHNFTTSEEAAQTLGGDTAFGDAGLDSFCLDNAAERDTLCAPPAGSPLVDAGLDSEAVSDITGLDLVLDHAGNPRISGAAVDIGAYEAVFHVCDINLDGAVSKADVVLISQALRSTVDAGTYGDIDNDGRITSRDTRGCGLQCTLARCAEPTP